MNKLTSQFLDFARWASAVVVVVTHLNNRMLTNLAEVPVKDRGLLTYGWGFLTGFGIQAVVIFFVLSGFLVGGKILQQISGQQPVGLRKFAVDRVVRIYVVLIPTLLWVALLDHFGERFFQSTGIYHHYDLPRHQTAGVIWGTLACVQGILTPFFGSNGPLTTLANEFWYYVTFPLLVAPWMVGRPPGMRFGFPVLGLLILGVWSVYCPWFGLGFVYWCVGAFARVAKGPLLVRNPMIAGGIFLAYLVGTRMAFRTHDMNDLTRFFSSLAVAFLLVNVILACMHSPGKPSRLLASPAHKALADFSYSLYAIHASLLTFVCAGLHYWTGFGWKSVATSFWQWTAVFAVLLGTLIIAKGFARVTEKHTHRFRLLGYRYIGLEPTASRGTSTAR